MRRSGKDLRIFAELEAQAYTKSKKRRNSSLSYRHLLTSQTTTIASRAQMIEVLSHPKEPLQHRCARCGVNGERKARFRCLECKVVRYCSKEHATAHRAKHSVQCKDIVKIRKLIEKEKVKLMEHVEFGELPPDPLRSCVCQFWDLFCTRPYMLARLSLGLDLQKIGTLDAKHEALGQYMALMRLSRNDFLHARHRIPFIMLQLDMDQDCYNHMKRFGNRQLQFEDEKDDGSGVEMKKGQPDEDAFESIENFLCTYLIAGLDSLTAIFLLKIKMLIDVRNMLSARRGLRGSKLPIEIIQKIGKDVVRSPLILKKAMLNDNCLSSLAKTLLEQAQTAATHMQLMNMYIFPALGEPVAYLGAFPQAMIERGSVQEAETIIQVCYPAFQETIGALAMVNLANWRTIRDLQNEYVDEPMARIRISMP